MINATLVQYIFAALLFGLFVLVMRGEARDAAGERKRPTAPAGGHLPPIEFLDADAPGPERAPPGAPEAPRPSADATSPAAFWDAVMTYAEQTHLPAATAVERDAWAFAVALLHAREDIERLGLKLAAIALDMRQAEDAGYTANSEQRERLSDVLTDRDAPALACHPFVGSFDVEGCALCALPLHLHSQVAPGSGDDPIVAGHLPHIGRLRLVSSSGPELRAGVGWRQKAILAGQAGGDELPRVRAVVHRGGNVSEIMRFSVDKREPCLPWGFHIVGHLEHGDCFKCGQPLATAMTHGMPPLLSSGRQIYHAQCVAGWHPEGEVCERCKAFCIDPMGADGPVIP